MNACLSRFSLARFGLALMLPTQFFGVPAQSLQPPVQSQTTNRLGPGDEVSVSVLGLKEIMPNTPIRVSTIGDLNLPMVGTVHVGGMTPIEAEQAIRTKLEDVMQDPQVSLRVTDYQSQPVSVIGAVANAGVKQVVGEKTILEMLSLAGGLKQDAGYQLKITRDRRWGTIPLAGARETLDGKFSVCDVNLRQLMNGTNPHENILVKPHDVLTVPTADLVYVLGEVNKPGGFVLHERENMSVLQAIALAEGIEKTAEPKHVRILHKTDGIAGREETELNLSKIMDGREEDRTLQPNDILIVPPNIPRKAMIRALETAVQIGAGVVIWRR